jgi:hypothetical protein
VVGGNSFEDTTKIACWAKGLLLNNFEELIFLEDSWTEQAMKIHFLQF